MFNRWMLTLVALAFTACAAEAPDDDGAEALASELTRCGDGNVCTSDTLVWGHCRHTPRPDGTACAGGACKAGVCMVMPDVTPDAGSPPGPTPPTTDSGADSGAPPGPIPGGDPLVPTFLRAWYVQRGATGAATGASWADAWPDTTAIDWTKVGPGDAVYLSGGTNGLAYSAFKTNKSGTASARITILRSTEPGRDGVVTLAAPVQIPSSFVTLDGRGWDKIVLNAYSAAGGGGGGALWITGDDFEVKHVKFNGNYAAGGAYHTLAGGKTLNTLRVSYCDFYKTAGEDHINWQGSKRITVDHSVFTTPNPPNDGSHRDLMNPWTGPGGYDLYFTNNIVYSLAQNGFAMLFQEPGQVGNIHISHNVFSNLPYVVQFGSGNHGALSIEMHSNVFHRTTDQAGSGPNATHKNDIFFGPSLTGTPVHYNSAGSNHCLWYSAGTMESGTGNVSGDPRFIDVTSPLGADGIPFTADDGFNLKSDSPARGAGASTGDLTNILGMTVVGAPNIGAY